MFFPSTSLLLGCKVVVALDHAVIRMEEGKYRSTNIYTNQCATFFYVIIYVCCNMMCCEFGYCSCHQLFNIHTFCVFFLFLLLLLVLLSL